MHTGSCAICSTCRDAATALQVEQWTDERNGGADEEAQPQGAGGGGAAAVLPDGGALQAPVHLVPCASFTPAGAVESALLTQREASALAAALPGRYAVAEWALRYATDSGGFSLQSLYRAGGACARSVLVVEDFGGFVFGAFVTGAWRVSPRYTGTGETFVFQLRPAALKYAWQPRPGARRNDFFVRCAADSLGVGGAPHFALWLDGDLLFGHSGACATFASPVLASGEEFMVKALELWQVGR